MDKYEKTTLFLPMPMLWQAEHLPCFVFDEAGIANTAREVCSSFSWNREYRPYFPVHVLPNPAILKILREAGMGVVCTDQTQLLLADRAGFPGEEIIFAPVIATVPAAALAAEMGCQLLLDNVNQIMRMECYRRLPDAVGLRYNPDERLVSGRHTLARAEEQGLGMDKASLYRAIAVLKSKGIRRIGLQAHLADQSDGRLMVAAAQLLLELAVDVQREWDVEIAYCDISGSLGDSHSPLEPIPDLAQLSRELEHCFHRVLEPAGLAMLPLRIQWGSYVVGMHGIFAAKVCDVKERRWRYLGLDATLSQLNRSFSPTSDYPVQLLKRGSSSVSRFYHGYGTALSVADRLMQHQFLPTAEIGDILIMERMGANVGEVSCAEYLYTKQGQLRLIRRPPYPEDALATLVE